MKITCPNCQKNYAINEAKLPPGVKTAKCKICGQLMPLKKAPAKASSKPAPIITIACLYCGQKHKLRQDKIPSIVNTINCKSCGRPVPLSQARSSAPVHSLKKESSALPADKPPAKPVEPPARTDDLIHLTCANCGKKYKIGQHKIPPRATAVKCKACGHKITLPQAPAKAATGDHLQPKAQPVDTPGAKSALMPAEEPSAIHRSRKKKWLLAMAAGVLLVVILGALASRHIIELDWLNQFFAKESEQATESTQLFAGGMEMAPTQGAVETRYATEPYIVTTVDSDRLKAIIPQMIRDHLFPGHYWSMGATPQMTLDLDTIDMPNAALAELTYEVKSIQSPDGKNVLRNEEYQNKPRIKPGSLFPGNISLSVKEATPPDDLAKASINFHLTVPVALEVFEFTVGDQSGSAKDAAGIQVTLGRLEKDVAQVSSSGEKSIRLIAYDQTGRALASRESINTASSVSTRFEGIIRTLKVVITRRMLEYPFGIEVDLNGGKALVLSREPEVPARMRFSPHPVPTYVDITAEDLQNLTVVWMEDQQVSWNDGLSLKLPQGPFSGYAIWEVHFFGNNTPYFLTGSSAQGIKDISFTLDKGTLKQVNAAFGKVQLNLHTAISRLVFVKKNNSQPAPQELPSGDKVSIKFNKNEITYSAGNADIIQTVAYDARGKRLKQDQYTRNKGDKQSIYFWGVPTRFKIDVTTQTIDKLVPFEIKQRPVDENAYSSFKQIIENQREVVHTIKSIDQARRKYRSYYGDDLAGLYYIYDRKQKKPLKLISREIAHSDPAGQDRFGYQAQPYKGYYFTVLSGVETNSVKKNYNRRSKKSRFTWQKGTITTTSLTRHPDLVAIPVDKSQPTFFLQWGQVFMKPLDGERLEYLPDGYYNKGWVEAKYIDS